MRERKLLRKRNYDYSTPGIYFVTICTHDRIDWFGDIVNEKIKLTREGEIAMKYLLEIPKHYTNIEIDEWVIMPNHIHIILIINWVGNGHCPFPTNTNYGQLSKVINGFKNATTKIIRSELKNYEFKWQKSFHDKIVKNEYMLYKIRNYIQMNPQLWENLNN